jgi:AraC-like DNA-binding protein
MPTIQTQKPHSALARYVRLYVQRDVVKGDAEIVEPVVARLGTMLEFQFGRPYEIPVYGTAQILSSPTIAVIGPVTHRRVELILREGVEALVVLFTPQGFHTLFRIPTLLLTNIGADAAGVLDREVSNLYEQLGNSKSFAQRTDLLNDFLLKRRAFVSPVSTIERALDSIIAGTHVNICDVARSAAITVRQLERKSLEWTGVSPKALVRIARFQRVLEMRRNGVLSWCDVAQAAGYCDQMHMTRDFREFAQESPARGSKQIHPEHLISF